MVSGTRDYNNVEVMNADGNLSLVTTPIQILDSAKVGQGEIKYNNSKWGEYNGYYRKNQGGSKAAIKKYSMWIVGKGYKTDESTKKKLEKIKGNGKDTFDSIMENMIRIKKVNGDSYAEIIKRNGKLINLKPLNPGSIQNVANDKGIIIGYDQIDNSGKVIGDRFGVDEIFHLMNDRDGDEIHGVSVYEGSTGMLDKIQQLDNDMTVVFHRYVMPFLIFKAKTDKSGEIAKLKAELKDSLNKGQGMIIPDKALDTDDFKIPQFSTLNPLDWRKEWKSEAIKDLGIPELVLGSADATVDASAKMVYLSFQQTIEDEQRETEQQLKAQLGIKLEYNFPARIEENLGEDEGKDGDINTTKKSEIEVTSIKKEDKNPSNSSTTASL